MEKHTELADSETQEPPHNTPRSNELSASNGTLFNASIIKKNKRIKSSRQHQPYNKTTRIKNKTD